MRTKEEVYSKLDQFSGYDGDPTMADYQSTVESVLEWVLGDDVELEP